MPITHKSSYVTWLPGNSQARLVTHNVQPHSPTQGLTMPIPAAAHLVATLPPVLTALLRLLFTLGCLSFPVLRKVQGGCYWKSPLAINSIENPGTAGSGGSRSASDISFTNKSQSNSFLYKIENPTVRYHCPHRIKMNSQHLASIMCLTVLQLWHTHLTLRNSPIVHILQRKSRWKNQVTSPRSHDCSVSLGG